MQNDLCPQCSGRGFMVQVRSDYGIDYARKNVCDCCGGSGQITSLTFAAILTGLFFVVVGGLLSYFVIYPLIAAWLDNVG